MIGNGKRVLFITPNDIYDKYGIGGVKATRENYRLVEECFGKENTYLCTFPRKDHVAPPQGSKTFKRTQNNMQYLFAALFGCKVYFPWDENKILNYIDKLSIDLLFIDSSIIGRLARVKREYKTIVFYHNIETDYALNKVKQEGLHFMPSYWASKYNDKCGTKADAVICLNDRDSARLFELYNKKADFILPITFGDIFKQSLTTNMYQRELLFLGSFFPPNIKSIEWFIERVMPKLNKIQLNIVGKGFEKKREEYEKNENVHVIGTVDELDKYYYEHAAVVLPIMYGAGMKVKTAEAMMFGRRIFASEEALEGYDVDGVAGITRCTSSDDFANAINQYFDRGIFNKYETDVRKVFIDKYEFNSMKERLFLFLEQILNDRYI